MAFFASTLVSKYNSFSTIAKSIGSIYRVFSGAFIARRFNGGLSFFLQ